MKKIKSLIIDIVVLIAIITSVKAQAKYVLPSQSKLLEASRDSTVAQIGVRERTGRNDGPKIQEYQQAVGIGRGEPYCAAGVYWCFAVSCSALSYPPTEIPIIRSGLANAIFSDASKRGNRGKYQPNNHDLIVWRRRNSSSGHIERVIQCGSAGWVTTVGFNTSSNTNGSQSEKEGVYRKKRNIFHPIGRLPVRGLIGFRAI